MSSDPAHAADVERSAEETARCFADAGLRAKVVRAGGLAAVLAHRSPPPGAPTVLLYAHHDVQPTGDVRLWDTDPFEPSVRGERMFARGAADDKAGVAAHLAALLAHADDLAVGVTVLVEGEEEIGSPSLPALLKAHRDVLRADVIVIADSVNWAVGTPAITTSLRGLVDVVVEVRTIEHPVHSGAWGGPVPDALTTLVRLLATLHAADGSVAVDGLTRSTSVASVEYGEARLRVEAGVLEQVRLWGSGAIADRLWNQPALTITGMDAPTVAGAASALTDVARAKISVRIAPGDKPEAARTALLRHLETHNVFGARLTVQPGPAAHPALLDTSSSLREAVMSSLRAAWGMEPVEIGVGGTLPLVHLFRAAFPDAAVLVTGVQDPDTRAHGLNESLHLPDFRSACVAEALLLKALAAWRPAI